MWKRKRRAAIGTGWLVGFASLFAIPVAILGLPFSEKPISVHSTSTFMLDVDFDKFRQILLRKNATAAIVEHGGMKLVNEEMHTLKIDLNKDRRPLLNALAGKSKSEVFATKRLMVELDDPQLTTKQLALEQDAKIQLSSIHVCSKSTEPAAELLSYVTTLKATKTEGCTEVSISVDMTIGVRVSPVFLSQAEVRVQQGADRAVLDQEKAIRNLVSIYDEKSGVAPTLAK